MPQRNGPSETWQAHGERSIRPLRVVVRRVLGKHPAEVPEPGGSPIPPVRRLATLAWLRADAHRGIRPSLQSGKARHTSAPAVAAMAVENVGEQVVVDDILLVEDKRPARPTSRGMVDAE